MARPVPPRRAACCRREGSPPPASARSRSGSRSSGSRARSRNRRRRAWQLAVVVVLASAIAHHGERARLRGGDRLARASSPRSCATAVASTFPASRVRRGRCSASPPRSRPTCAVILGIELHGGEIPDRLSDVFTALGFLLGFGALYLWLRPLSQVVAQTVGERRVARALVDAYGHDSLSFFALRRDKSYFFSPTRRLVPRVSRRRGHSADQRRPGRRGGRVRCVARRSSGASRARTAGGSL